MVDSERIGPYRVVQKLGSGGMGEVVLAHDDRLDRLVAIKRLHGDLVDAAHSRERFRREARIAARLNHPAIVQIHDVLHERDQDYLVMEYVAGQTLRARRSAGPMTVSEVLGIAHQIALGMATAHDLGVVHRDLKAENVLLTRSGLAKITDFGIAKLPGDDSVTAEGAVVGTFRAMSPEQALGRTIDHRSDLFSFGILLYEMLAGESPFRADTPYLTVQRLVLDEPRPLGELVPGIPAGLASLIHQLLAKEPLLRPRDFHEVAAMLIELAGAACDVPCHGGADLGGPPGPGEDPRPTEDGYASITAVTEDLTPSPAIDSHHHPDAYAHPAVPRAPAGRWQTTALWAATVAALGIGYAAYGTGSHAAPRAPLVRVAVLAPRGSGADGNAGIALLAVAVRNAIMSDLRARTGLELVPWGDIERYVADAAHDSARSPTQRAIRAAMGADEVIATDLQCASDSCRVTLERDAEASGVPPPESFQLATDTAARPSATVSAHLSRLYPDHPALETAGTAVIDPADQARYLRLVQDYWAGIPLPSEQLLAEIDAIRERSSQSIDVLLFEVDVLRHRYLETEDPALTRRSLKLLDDADRLFPDTYDIISARFDIQLSAGRTEDAGATLDHLDTLDPDSRTTHLQHAKLARARGQLDQARIELDAAAQRDALSWSVPYYRALLLRDLGDRAGGRQAVSQLLARSPGNYAGLSMRAHDEFEDGHLACAEQLYARLVARQPLYNECVNLGYVRSQLGRYREAATSFRCALQMQPDTPEARLDLAESLLLAGDTDAATEHLRSAYQLLIRRRRDAPDGELRGADPLVEAQTLAYLGRTDTAMAAEARARVTALLTAASSRRAALYTAALVHAALGDHELAARYVTECLDAGDNPATFALPWFDNLRRDPVLGPRLVVPAAAATCDDAAAR